MEYNPNESKAQLIAPAKYVALCFKGEDKLTQKGAEIWNLHFKLLAVFDVKDENEQDAAESVGMSFTDRLIDLPFMGSKWDMVLPVMFPGVKSGGNVADVHARNCPGKIVVLKIGIGKGREGYEAAKVNRAYKYEPFEGDLAPYQEKIDEIMAEYRDEDEAPGAQQESQPGTQPETNKDEFAGQF